MVSDVTVVLLDCEGEVFAGEELMLGDAAMVAVPVVGQEDPTLESDLGEEAPTGRVVTVIQYLSPPCRCTC